jgi:cell wall-associated NlpC family hydrolase
MIYCNQKKTFLPSLLLILPFIFSFSSPYSSLYDEDPTRILLRTAKKYVGAKYKSGGKSPKGFDCSGFVRYVYKKVQITLDGDSSAALYKKGEEIPKKQCQPGDLIFFAQSSSKAKRISHVGIVVSSDSTTTKFNHASTSKGVIISNLNSPYYKQRFAGVRRIPYLQENAK